MHATKTINSGVTLYEATDTLAAGPHSYYFRFSAGSKAWVLPVNGVPFAGPQVSPFDVTGVKVTPEQYGAEAGTGETFSAVYTSPSGKPATTAEVIIDDVVHQMTATSGQPATGVHYRFTTSSLSDGDHDLQFAFNDGSGLQKYYSSDAVAISPIVLYNSHVRPTSGSTSTSFKFSTVYYGPDLPKKVDVIVGGVAHPMSKVSGTPRTGVTYEASTTLPAGSHSFNFYATDGTTQWNSPREPGMFHGLKVVRAGQVVTPSAIVAPPVPPWQYAYDPG
jgi:hypothetical protein